MKAPLINDIFPPVEIPDNSFFSFIILVSIGLILLSFGFYRFYKKRAVKQLTAEEKQLNILKACDLENVRQSAYQISYYGKLLASTSEEKRLLDKIILELTPYKYQQDLSHLPDSIKEQLQLFITLLERKHV